MITEAFDRAFERTLHEEGGYANSPHDPGGETWRGVARKRHPTWPGWRIVDRLRDRADFPLNLAHDDALDGMLRQFYFDEFWTPLHCDQLPETIAAKLFDSAVNTGHEVATSLLQGALYVTGERLEVDGKLGPKSIAAAHRRAVEPLLPRYWSAVLVGFYICLVLKKNPKLHIYLNGWLARAMR